MAILQRWTSFNWWWRCCEINLTLTWLSNCVITNLTGTGKFAITDTKLVTLSTENNAKLLQQLKFGFKRTINWNKYLSKISIKGQIPHLHYLIDSSFQGLNKLFVLWFEDNAVRNGHKKYFLPTVEIKDYNVMIDGKKIKNTWKHSKNCN